MIGGVPGILIGSLGTGLVSSVAAEPVNPDVDGIPQPLYVAEVSDDLSFGEAFAAARAQVGPGEVFKWNAMSPEERAEFADSFSETPISVEVVERAHAATLGLETEVDKQNSEKENADEPNAVAYEVEESNEEDVVGERFSD